MTERANNDGVRLPRGLPIEAATCLACPDLRDRLRDEPGRARELGLRPGHVPDSELNQVRS